MTARKFIVSITILSAIFISACFLGACSNEPSVQDRGYTIRVTYDCAGGMIGNFPQRNQWAKPGSLLIRPGDKKVPNNIAAPIRSDHEFIDWFRGTKDEDGIIEYGEKWNYDEDRVTKDVTLYAKWIINRSYAIHYLQTVASGDGVETHTPAVMYNYIEPGAESIQSFSLLPQRNGYTLEGTYMDEECNTPVVFPLIHTGGDENRQDHFYTKWIKGDYILVRKATDMSDIETNKNYYLMNNIDFTGVNWNIPAFYSGEIQGNGFTVKGIKINHIKATNKYSEYSYCGLFSSLSAGAKILNITIIADMEFQVSSLNSTGNGSKSASGFLAGKIEAGCVINNVTLSGSVKVWVDKSDLSLHFVGYAAYDIAQSVDMSACYYQGNQDLPGVQIAIDSLTNKNT